MERARYPESRESVEIKDLIRSLASKASGEQAMNGLENKLLNALGAAKAKKGHVMELTFQSAYESYNALADNRNEIREQMEEIIRKIRTLVA
jgi:S-adenosylhomocysteine hydrolase